MIAYKFLSAGAVAPFTGFRWPVPGPSGPGDWVEAAGELPDRGIHACREDDLAFWLDAELWRAELSDPIREAQRQVVARRGRLLERVSAWDRGAALELAERSSLLARDRIARALEAAAFEQEAARLASSRELRGLLEASRAISSTPGLPSSLAPYLVEAAETALAGDVPVSAYISARAAVASSGGREDEFAAERANQARWLAARLKL